MASLDIFLDRVDPDGGVIGTNNGDAVTVGATFVRLVSARFAKPGDASAFELWSAPIELRLVGADVFHKPVATVPHGFSAKLRFEGSGLAAIADALGRKASGEFVHLKAADAV